MSWFTTCVVLSLQMKGLREFPDDVKGAGDVLSHLSKSQNCMYNPDSRDPWIDVNKTLIRHKIVIAMSCHRQSWGLGCPSIDSIQLEFDFLYLHIEAKLTINKILPLISSWPSMSWRMACGLLPGPRLNIKTFFPRYGDSHVKDKTVARPSYF